MEKLKATKKFFFILVTLFILGLFAYITKKTPLAGDDWGYALNAAMGNPFQRSLDFYQSWSGRYFSELWGFIITPRRHLWNLINPLLFASIFVSIYKLGNVKKHVILVPLLILSLMLSVDHNLRMETYTWIMGTTYIIPLALSLIYFILAESLIYDQFKWSRWLYLILSNGLVFYIGLTMENIAAMMIFAIIVLMIYCMILKRNLLYVFASHLVFSTMSFMIMRMSPGSTLRMVNDNAAWMKLNLFEKIANGYPYFIEFTFTRNVYLIIFVSIIMMMLLIWTKYQINQKLKLILGLIQGLAIFMIFLQPSDSLSFIFWPIYLISVLIILFVTLSDAIRERAIFYFMVGGVGNLVMMYSPIFGSRSAIYTLYYLILVLVIVLKSIEIQSPIKLIAILACLGISGYYTCFYLDIYQQVEIIEIERQGIYQYYRDNPEVEEAWIPRFPENSIHGGDVEIGDSYHFETFKQYYQLPQSAENIIFFNK